MKTDKVINGLYLVFTLFMRIGTDHGIACLTRLVLNTIQHGCIIMGHQIGYHDTDDSRRLFTKTLGKRVGTIIKTLCESLYLFLHLKAYLR